MLRCAALLSLAACLPAQQTESLLQRLPADTTNLLVVRDVLPLLDTVLTSPELAELLTATRELQDQAFGQHFDAAALRRQIGLFARFIPREAGFAAPPSVASFAVDLIRAAVAGGMLTVLSRAEPGQQDAVDLAADMVADLGRLDRLDLQVWAKTRDERTAEGWFDNIEQLLRAQDLGPGFELSVHDGELTLRVQPTAIGDGMLAGWLTSLGVKPDAAWNPTFTAKLTQIGARLSLQVGEAAKGPLPAAALGRLWSDDPKTLLFLRADWGADGDRLLDLPDQLQPFVESDQPQTAAMATRLLASLSEVIDSLGARSAALRIDGGMRFVVEEEFGDEARQELEAPAAGIVRCLAPAEGPFALLAVPFDVAVAANLETVLDRLVGRGNEVPEVLSGIADLFYGEDSAVFEPGTLLVGRAAQFRGGVDWQHGAMPFAAAAIVAKVTAAQSAADFMADLSARIADATRHEPLFVAKDFGLGVPTQALDLEHWLPELAAMRLDMDFAPHWFVVDDVLVIATDPKLSQDLMARIRGQETPQVPAGNLLAWSRCTGDQCVSLCDGLRRWVEVLPRPESIAGPLQLALHAMAALLGTIDTIENRIELDGTVLRDQTTLSWKSGK